jgi:hypothetical protein
VAWPERGGGVKVCLPRRPLPRLLAAVPRCARICQWFAMPLRPSDWLCASPSVVSLTDLVHTQTKNHLTARLSFSLSIPSSRTRSRCLCGDITTNALLHFRQSPSPYRTKHSLQESTAFQNDRGGADGSPWRSAA